MRISENLTVYCRKGVCTLNSCYTYFTIVGDFNPDEITEKLGLEPFAFWQKGDKRPNGMPYTFSRWSFGKCSDYDVEVSNQMLKTITPIIDKIDLLNEIREKYEVSYYIEVVPEIYTEESTPALGVNLAVIDFCHATRTEIDIDLYVCE